MNILVSGASGIVGYGILKSLKGHNLIGTTIYDYSVAPAFCKAEKILPTDDKAYLYNLIEIIEKHNIDMAIPSIECDMYKWNIIRELLPTFPLLNNRLLIHLCEDKWPFYQKLNMLASQYAIPTTLDIDFNRFDLPFLLKPRKGFGSKGIIRINDRKDFDSYFLGQDLMQQPIIGTEDEEYTVSGFFDENSNLIDYFPLRRKLLHGSTNEAIVEDRNFGEVLSELAQVFKPIGPTNFQFRMYGDVPKLLEINPRISSATSIRAALGYNEAQMSIDYFLNNELPVPVKKPIGKRAIRYTEDYIF